MARTRLRDLGMIIGDFPPGPHNAITDVPGVWVGHHTLIYDQPRVARTGVTVIAPRENQVWQNYVFAAYHVFNGYGEMTGLPWLDEVGMLGSAIGITNTHQVGIVRDAFVAYAVENGYTSSFLLPVVAETYDGWLNDIDAFHLTKEHVYAALADAKAGPVPEGNVGGGTGMICHEFKGGIGTASRVIERDNQHYTVGALVQANYGRRPQLRLDGIPVGREIDAVHTPTPRSQHQGNSIIIVVGTDAPLLPVQCKRLAQRATVGLARVGGTGHNGSGDIFLAFATGNDLPASVDAPRELKMLPHRQLDPLFDAVAEAVEEAILNVLTAAETMSGYQEHTAYALPLDILPEIIAKYRPR